MAEPVKGTPVLTGKAARDFIRYMKNSKPDPEKRRRLEKALKTHSKIVQLDAS